MQRQRRPPGLQGLQRERRRRQPHWVACQRRSRGAAMVLGWAPYGICM